MQIATSGSDLANTQAALEEAVNSLTDQMDTPDFLLVYCTESHDIELVRHRVSSAFPNAQFIGCTSCQGAICDSGFYQQNALVLWAVDDPSGAYGTMITSYSAEDVFEKAQLCIERAIVASERAGELPSLVILHATPGYEEDVIAGIQSVIGQTVPVVGGSAADDHIEGQWSIMTDKGQTQQGLALSVLYPSSEITISFHSGYANTGEKAVATRVEGREIVEFDGKPAADVYQAWLDTQPIAKDRDFFDSAGLNPLGRIAGEINGLAYFKLSHPFKTTERGGIELFSRVETGEEVFFMVGTKERLVKRAGRVINSALESGHVGDEVTPIGGLAIYCAGCMLQVKEMMPDVQHFMYNAMHQKPFACPFTFGEQGQFVGGENAHGNLMISAVLFHSE